MSVSKDGVSLVSDRRKKRFGIFALILVLEAAFSFFLYLSLVGHIFSPDPSQAAAGVPKLISYQGRLTDTSGNPLGGSGTVYCFRYSIYDAVSGGNKAWPSGTPTTATTTVRDGIFSDQIGRSDSLAGFDFFATSTLYLNVEANTATSTCSGSWETLSPRQQITAAGFALTSDDVYGDALRTPTSTKVQIGTGGGVSSGQTLLSLDVKNAADSLGAACSDNGSLWYNSVNTRALICENGTIQPLSNSSTTISGIGTNAAAPITAGNVVFSNSNGVSFGQNGSTITASVNAGGGGATLSRYPNIPWGVWSSAGASLYSGSTSANGASTHSTMSYYVQPLDLNNAIAFSKVQIIGSQPAPVAGTGSNTLRYYMGIYTMNAGTLSLSTSWMAGYVRSQNSATAQTFSFYTGSNSASIASFQGNSSVQLTGVRILPVYQGAAITLSAGQYYVVNALHSITSGISIAGQTFGVGGNSSYVALGNNTSATSRWAPMVGVFSSTSSTNAGGANQWLMPSSVNSTAVSHTNAASHFRDLIIMFRNE